MSNIFFGKKAFVKCFTPITFHPYCCMYTGETQVTGKKNKKLNNSRTSPDPARHGPYVLKLPVNKKNKNKKTNLKWCTAMHRLTEARWQH